MKCRYCKTERNLPRSIWETWWDSAVLADN